MVTEIGSNLWNCLNVTEIDDFTFPGANCVPIRDVEPEAIKSCCHIFECEVKLDTNFQRWTDKPLRTEWQRVLYFLRKSGFYYVL